LTIDLANYQLTMEEASMLRGNFTS